MSSYKLIFEWVASKIAPSYTVTLGSIVEDKPQAVGVFFEGGTPRRRVITSGEYLERTVSVFFNLQGSRDTEGIEGAIDALDALKNILDTTHDLTISDNTTILYNDCFTDISMLGFNGFGLPCFSMTYIIRYTERGN